MRRLPIFSNSDRRALLLLEWVLLLAVAVVALLGWHGSGKMSHPSSSVDSVRSADAKRPYGFAQAEEPVETFPFDPNTADSTTLLRLGLAPWQVKAIYSYRAKHGRYHEPADFRRLPGMTNETWERLKPCIRIDRRFQYVDPEPRRLEKARNPAAQPAMTETASRPQVGSEAVAQKPESGEATNGTPSHSASEDSVRDTVLRPVKFAPGTVIDLNEADTTMLKKVPGIASYRARKIVEYRQRLGGFRTKEQVMEACQLPDEVLDWFAVRPVPLVRLDANSLSVNKLMKHPYLSFYQAKAIVDYRNKFGPLRSIQELQNLKEFTPEDIERLRDYLEFR